MDHGCFRCPGLHPQGGFDLPPTLTLQLLLEHCERWIGEVDINAEMPELFFYVSGANGNRKKVKLSPNNYVLAKYMDVEACRRLPGRDSLGSSAAQSISPL